MIDDNYHWGTPEWAPPSVAAGRNVCLFVCLYRTSSVYVRMHMHWPAKHVLSLNRSQPVPLYNCVQLATRVLYSSVWKYTYFDLESYEQLWSTLTKSGGKEANIRREVSLHIHATIHQQQKVKILLNHKIQVLHNIGTWHWPLNITTAALLHIHDLYVAILHETALVAILHISS